MHCCLSNLSFVISFIFTASESLMSQISTQSFQLSKFMIWCFLITILINLGCQLFQNHSGYKRVLSICIVFYSISIMLNKTIRWTPKLAKSQICCFLQCVRYHFCIWVASILVASKFSFAQNAVFYYELWATPSQNLSFLRFCCGALVRQRPESKMGTKSDAKTIGWGTTW